MTERHLGVPLIATMALAAVVALTAGCGGNGNGDGDGSNGSATTAAPTAAAGGGTATATAPTGPPAADPASPATSPRTARAPSPGDPDDTSAVLRVSAWTSQPLRVDHNPAAVPRLIAVRSAHHEEMGVDRLVFEFEGQLPGYDVRYVPEVLSPGEGAIVALRGQAFMELVFYPAASHDDTGSSTLRTSSGGGSLPGLHEYKMAGDFEGYVHYGLGVDDVVGFRVTEFAHPSRIAIDISA